MPPEKPSQLSQELLDDFYLECDEHLSNIRHALAKLEPYVGKAQADTSILEDLFRNFHSFKGISALAGLSEAEKLAHGAEDFLRALNRGRATLTGSGLELLMSTAQKLEQTVSVFRGGKPMPQVDGLVASLQKEGGVEGSEGAPSMDASPVSGDEAAEAGGQMLWKCLFVPSRELEERGVTLKNVRARLGAAGEILHEHSQVRGGDQVVFEFLLATRETPADIAQWESEGIQVELMEQAPPSPPLPGAEGVGAAGEAVHNPFIAPSHFVRVDLGKLDELMRIAGEMVVTRSRFEEQIKGAEEVLTGPALEAFREVNTAFSRSLRELRQAIMRVRLVPVAEVFARMPFVVRDLSRDSSKAADLILEGQQTELDKHLIERLKDPLLHLVRNAFSHGIEAPAERMAAGKEARGKILLRAMTQGDSVLIQIRDDGRGIDVKQVAKRAAALGLAVPEPLDPSTLLRILCAPGFSTREDADRAAGRGVGMGVAYSIVKGLGGSIALETEPGKGTQFTLRLPLTLAIAESFIVTGAGQTCAIPQSFVSEVFQVTEKEMRKVNQVEVAPYRSGVLPIIRLSSLFGLPPAVRERGCVLVLTSERGSTGLLVEGVKGQREVVVRAIRDPLVQVAGVIGATELGDGRPVLILDGDVLTSGAVRPHAAVKEAGGEDRALTPEMI